MDTMQLDSVLSIAKENFKTQDSVAFQIQRHAVLRLLNEMCSWQGFPPQMAQSFGFFIPFPAETGLLRIPQAASRDFYKVLEKNCIAAAMDMRQEQITSTLLSILEKRDILPGSVLECREFIKNRITVSEEFSFLDVYYLDYATR